jgi:hypothetical protein
MGGEEDPKDGSAVAGAVFGAVFIYIVRLSNESKDSEVLTLGRDSSSSADYKPSSTCAKAVAAR